MKTIFIVAGDPSGDIHASRLMKAMKDIDNSIEFFGIGGDNMSAEGLNLIESIEKMSVTGFWEVAKRYKFLKSTFDKCVNYFVDKQIDAFIPVDYPGFNIKLAKKAKINNIPVIYYIAPQLWAWGKNRAKKLQDRVDLLLTVFPFETDFFAKFNIKTEFIGHPLLDDTIMQKFPIDFSLKANRIAFLPGSREQELRNHLPLINEIASEFLKLNPNFQIAIAKSKALTESLIKEYKLDDKNWEIWDNSIELMSSSKIGFIKTGTSNLEAALCGLPFVMFYKTSFLSYMLSKNLINLPYISLVNILLDAPIIPEIIQRNINPQSIAKELNNLLITDNYNSIQNKFQEIRNILGGPGASENAAKIITDFI